MSRQDTRAGIPSKRRRTRAALMTGVAASLMMLAGCDGNGKFALGLPQGAKSNAADTTKSTKLVERDVEAPEVFSATDQGLWDGRPSLGGVWVAHPDVTEPERVIIRNTANGKFVIGALFRRERDLPGPKLQMSSDAAEALGVLAGAPAPLNVTALRREEAEPDAQAATPAPASGTVSAPAQVTETTIDPIASAAAAIDAAAPAPQASNLAKPFVQIGIFSVEANANRAAKQMRGAGLAPTVRKSTINGKAFWRVIVGPAANKSELNKILKTIKSEGFSDAYAVSS